MLCVLCSQLSSIALVVTRVDGVAACASRAFVSSASAFEMFVEFNRSLSEAGGYHVDVIIRACSDAVAPG